MVLHPGLLDQEKLVTSIHVSPKTLLYVRSFWLVYTILCLILEIVYFGRTLWGFFTEWTWLGLIFYLSTAVYNSHLYVTKSNALATMEARPYWMKYSNWLLYALPATYVYIVSIVFWALLASVLSNADSVNSWLTVSQHALNSVIMIGELVLGRIPLAYAFMIPFIVIALMYLGIALVFHAVYGSWSYGFLDTSKPMWYLWYIGVILFFVIEFVVVVYIHNSRDRRRERLQKSVLRVNGVELDKRDGSV
ncbi:hypothetical protein HDU79_003173 [Rhizoclosmatium sp. JEL0117]|nr:hypothetical protein HDU79_003173 [Rhizoclosmatium sp. JEL0117]